MKARGIRWKGTPAAAALTVSTEKTIAIPLFFRLRQPQREPCTGALPKIRLSEIPPNDLIIFKGKGVNHDQVNGLSKKCACCKAPVGAFSFSILHRGDLRPRLGQDPERGSPAKPHPCQHMTHPSQPSCMLTGVRGVIAAPFYWGPSRSGCELGAAKSIWSHL